MQNTTERRQLILEFISDNRCVKMQQIADTFDKASSTPSFSDPPAAVQRAVCEAVFPDPHADNVVTGTIRPWLGRHRRDRLL